MKFGQPFNLVVLPPPVQDKEYCESRNNGVKLLTRIASSGAQVVVSALYFPLYCVVQFLRLLIARFCIPVVAAIVFTSTFLLFSSVYVRYFFQCTLVPITHKMVIHQFFNVSYKQFTLDLFINFVIITVYLGRFLNLDLQIMSKILVIIFLNFTMFQYRSDSPQVKRNVISSIGNLACELLQELSNDLRLRILVNKEISGKSQIWVETYPSPQSLFYKLNFGQTSNPSCPVQFHWTPGFLYPAPNTVSRTISQEWQKVIEEACISVYAEDMCGPPCIVSMQRRV